MSDQLFLEMKSLIDQIKKAGEFDEQDQRLREATFNEATIGMNETLTSIFFTVNPETRAEQFPEAMSLGRGFVDGARWQHEQNKPLITAMADRIEQLEGALEFYADKTTQVHISKIEQDPEVGEFIHANDLETIIDKEWCGTFSGKRARQALTTPTALDKILKQSLD